MNKFLSSLFIAAGLAVALPQAVAQDGSASASKPAAKPAPKKTVKKKAPAKKKTPAKKDDHAVSDKEDEKVDTTGHASTSYHCEHGHKITVYRKSNDDKQITVRWRDKLHSLLRVNTTTGADRFEGHKSGLIWVGIPTKAMLLDGHKGQPLANECMDAAQKLKHST